jgi:hypothetical protein
LPARQSGAGVTQPRVNPPIEESCAHTVPAPHRLQLVTSLHSVAGMQGPQHELSTLGTVPAGQLIGCAGQVTFVVLQLRASTQRPNAQVTSLRWIWLAAHASWVQIAGQLGRSVPFGVAAHVQQSANIWQSEAVRHSAPPPPAPPAPVVPAVGLAPAAPVLPAAPVTPAAPDAPATPDVPPALVVPAAPLVPAAPVFPAAPVTAAPVFPAAPVVPAPPDMPPLALVPAAPALAPPPPEPDGAARFDPSHAPNASKPNNE